jgi:hypothetical protein
VQLLHFAAAPLTLNPTTAVTIRGLTCRGGESLAGWLARAHDGRQRTALLGDCDADMADPVGGPQQAYAETAATLSQLLDRLVDLCWAA